MFGLITGTVFRDVEVKESKAGKLYSGPPSRMALPRRLYSSRFMLLMAVSARQAAERLFGPLSFFACVDNCQRPEHIWKSWNPKHERSQSNPHLHR